MIGKRVWKYQMDYYLIDRFEEVFSIDHTTMSVYLKDWQIMITFIVNLTKRINLYDALKITSSIINFRIWSEMNNQPTEK